MFNNCMKGFKQAGDSEVSDDLANLSLIGTEARPVLFSPNAAPGLGLGLWFPRIM